MTAAQSRWARRYVLVSLLALVSWQLGALVGLPRGTEVALGVLGFVLHMIFGKAYALVPSYVGRDLAVPQAPALQFPLSTVGTVGIAAATLEVGPGWLPPVAVTLWSLGVGVFAGTLLYTVAGPLLAGETATGSHNDDRRAVDRFANRFVPVALGYLVVGSVELAAVYGAVPPPISGYPPAATHLLAAGTGALFVFALGFRLLPRFLGVHPADWLVRLVLPAGAVGPVLIAAGMGNRRLLLAGAAVEGLAVCLYALAVVGMVRRSDHRRIGVYGVVAGACCGVGGVLFGGWFAVHGVSAAATIVHLRLTVLGFLGLTIVGIASQFYPPTVGSLPWSSDRAGLLSIGTIAGGLVVQTGALLVPGSVVGDVGLLLTAGGSVLYASLLAGTFAARPTSRGG